MTKQTKWCVRPAKTRDQPGHPPDWSVFARRSVGNQGPTASLCGQWRLIRLGGCPGWSESSLAAQVILLVLSWCGSLYLKREWVIKCLIFIQPGACCARYWLVSAHQSWPVIKQKHRKGINFNRCFDLLLHASCKNILSKQYK